jgi:hypothetical protein
MNLLGADLAAVAALGESSGTANISGVADAQAGVGIAAASITNPKEKNKMEQKTGAAGSAAGAATFRPSDTSESLSVANVQGFVTGIDASTKSQATTDSDEASVSVDASAKGSVDKDGVYADVVGSVVASDFDGYTVTGLTFFDEEIIDYDTSTELEDEDSVLFTEASTALCLTQKYMHMPTAPTPLTRQRLPLPKPAGVPLPKPAGVHLPKPWVRVGSQVLRRMRTRQLRS